MPLPGIKHITYYTHPCLKSRKIKNTAVLQNGFANLNRKTSWLDEYLLQTHTDKLFQDLIQGHVNDLM
jgi:hypothetical protein